MRQWPDSNKLISEGLADMLHPRKVQLDFVSILKSGSKTLGFSARHKLASKSCN